jgi:hypothetical protein
LAVKNTPTGLIVYCHAGCRPADILAELRRLGLFGGYHPRPFDPAGAARQGEQEATNRARRIAAALDLWSQTVPASDTLVETYLWSRLICIPAPSTIRLHWSLWHSESGQRRPALVSLVEHVDFGPVAVHATYLAIDGSQKACLDPVRRSFGPVRGAAVRLAPVGNDGRLVIGEGIETVLSVMLSTGLPGWAALSASGIKRLILPSEARYIVIVADNDQNRTGQRAALEAAWRFRREGRRVRIVMPPVPGDFNDCLLCRIPAAGADRVG